MKKNFIFTLIISFFLVSLLFVFTKVSAETCLNLTSNLAIGSKDAHYTTPDVTRLQNFMVSQGLLTATPNGYFGFQSQDAVKAFQLNNGLEVTGFVGPLTREKIRSLTCGVNVPVSQTTLTSTVISTPSPSISNSTPLSIGDFINLLITIGVITPDKLPAVSAWLASSNNIVSPITTTIIPNSSTDIINSVVVETVTSSGSGGGSGSAQGEYTITYDGNGNTGGSVPIDSNDHRGGTHVTVLDNSGSLVKTGYIFSGWNTLANGSGTDHATSSTFLIGSANIILYAQWTERATLTLSTDPLSPDAQTVIASDGVGNNEKDGVTLLTFDLRAEEDDVTVTDLQVAVATSTGSATLQTVYLYHGATQLASSSPSGGFAIFSDIDFLLTEATTTIFTVKADVRNATTSVTSWTATITDADIIADDIASESITGSATGEAQEFRTPGISVTLVSTNEVKNSSDINNEDTATFTIRFRVTAVGDDVYLATTVASGVTYVVDYSGTATTTDISATLVNDTDVSVTPGGLWLIEEGTNETITLTVLRNGSATDGLYRTSLTGIRWTDTDVNVNPLPNIYDSNLDDFRTDYVSLD